MFSALLEVLFAYIFVQMKSKQFLYTREVNKSGLGQVVNTCPTNRRIRTASVSNATTSRRHILNKCLLTESRLYTFRKSLGRLYARALSLAILAAAIPPESVERVKAAYFRREKQQEKQ